ncbi:MAG: M48 family metallopeptidase [Chloroflexi bacterium]|nr:M48 family metallopeptidase [Chloroflexota bacterium]
MGNDSIIGRVLLAILLTVGFYGLALGFAGGLLFLVAAQFMYTDHFSLRLTIFGVIGAGVILISIVPRPGPGFEPPWPRLNSNNQPRLFEEIRNIASATGQRMPEDVYLVGEVNAYVGQRGRTRFMGIGLPLLQGLTVSQLRAVLAHEFGHYYGGDTRVGPFIYGIRATIGRTVMSMEGSALGFPFRIYGNLFMLATQSVSRRQEFNADLLAARVGGSQAAIEGLRTIHGIAPAFDAYWQSEVGPVLEAGYHPPIIEGFERFLSEQSIASKVEESIEEQLHLKADPYDTHPGLGERIDALQGLPAGDTALDSSRATTLMNDVSDLERQLVVYTVGPGQASKLRPISWDNVGGSIYEPGWEKSIAGHTTLRGETLGGLAALVKTHEKLTAQVEQWAVAYEGSDRPMAGREPLYVVEVERKDLPSDIKAALAEELEGIAAQVIGAAVALTLARNGWTVKTDVGKEIGLHKDGMVIEPWTILGELSAEGEESSAAWQALCEKAGITDLDLGAVVSGNNIMVPPGPTTPDPEPTDVTPLREWVIAYEANSGMIFADEIAADDFDSGVSADGWDAFRFHFH